MYAGLRRGELLALHWEDIDFYACVIRVERAHDPRAEVFVRPKPAAGRRIVMLLPTLRKSLEPTRRLLSAEAAREHSSMQSRSTVTGT